MYHPSFNSVIKAGVRKGLDYVIFDEGDEPLTKQTAEFLQFRELFPNNGSNFCIVLTGTTSACTANNPEKKLLEFLELDKPILMEPPSTTEKFFLPMSIVNPVNFMKE